MDMWQPYKDAVKAVLPKATIIVDKFHVVRMANQALETIRKQLKEGLSPKERRGLMHDRFILLKRHKELTEMEKVTLDLWTKNHPSLGIAYELKESFFELWDIDSRQKAYLKYHEWKAKIPKELQTAIEPLTKAMENWEAEIFFYFDHRVTNAYTESLKSLIRVITVYAAAIHSKPYEPKYSLQRGLQNNGSLSISGGSINTSWRSICPYSRCLLLVGNQKKLRCLVSIFPP